jgi:hypothetical protein
MLNTFCPQARSFSNFDKQNVAGSFLGGSNEQEIRVTSG